MRQALAALADQNQANLAERLAVADSDATAAGTEHVPARTALSQAACLVRAAAPIGLPPLDPDPVAVLAGLRLCNSFWSGMPGEPWTISGARPPRTSRRSSSWRRPAICRRRIKCCGVIRPPQRQFDRLQALLESRRSAARSGIAMTATDLLLIKDDEPGIGSIDVRRMEGAAGEAVPAGRLGVWFRDASRPHRRLRPHVRDCRS